MPYSTSRAPHSTGDHRIAWLLGILTTYSGHPIRPHCFTCYFELNLMHCSLVDVLSLSLVMQGTLDETVQAGMMHAHVCLAANCQSPMGALATDKCAPRGLLYLSIKPSAI
jgi:hypothetical protein